MRHTTRGQTLAVLRGRSTLFSRTSSFAFWAVAALILLGLASYASLSLLSAPTTSAVTTVPTKLNFQGRLTDSAGTVKPSGTYNMRFKLYTVATAGSAVWSEDRLVSASQGVTVTNGQFSVQLGSVTALPASLFASGALYLEIELPTPATATTSSPSWTEGAMTPRNQMATSAYAYNSETLDGQDGDYYLNAGNLTGTVSSARLSGSYTGITGTGALAAGSIASGFGTILTGNTITGATLNGTTGINTGAGAGTQRIDASGNLVNVGTIGASGNITTTGNVVVGASTLFGTSLTAQKEQNVSSVTVTGAGWYRVATLSGSAGRGQNTVTVYTTGGAYAPFSTSIRWWHDYSTTAGISVISETGGGYWSQARVTDDGTNSYLEINFTQALTSALSLSLQYDGGFASGSLYSGTLGAGAGTVRATASLGLLNIGTDKLTVSNAGDIGMSGTTVLSSSRALQNVVSVTSSGVVSGTQLASTIATGTAPLTVASTTLVTNLNADLLDGQSGAYYQSATNLNAGTVSGARLTGAYTGITQVGTLTSLGLTGNLQVGTNMNLSAMAQNLQVNAGSLGTTAGNEMKLATFGGNSTNQDGLTISLYRATAGTDWTTANVVLGRNVDNTTRAGAYMTLGGNTTRYVGINTVTPGYTLDVQGGDINTSGALRIGGTTICTSSGCTPTGGAGASLAGNNTFTGTNLFKPSTNSTTALQIQNSSSTSLLTVNTTNMRLSVAGSEVTRSADYSVSYVPTFGTKTDYTTGTGPQEVTSADFNTDGKSDIAAVNYSSNTISVFINNGSGTFAAKVDYATGSLPNSIISGDFNADGKPDIAATNSNAASFSVFINNGSGTFAAKVDYATGTTPISLTAGDYSGDGKLDIVVASSYISGIDYVSKYTNNGTGTFSARVDVASGNSSPYEVEMGDINNDGLKDIITAGSNSNGGNNISYYRNTGGGSFATAVDYAVLSVGNIAVADVNNDNYDDVIAGAGANISILKNNGAGSLSQRTDISSWVSIQKITTTDINGDGLKDIVLVDNHGGNSSASSISVILNNGDGTYTNKTNFGVGIAPLSATMADFNADSIPDAAAVNSFNGAGGNSVSVLFNQTPPTTSQAATGTLSVRTTASGSGGLYIQGSASQTASLLAIQDSSGAGLFVVDAYGSVRAKGAIQGGVGSPDYAENITASDPSIGAADVVAMDPEHKEQAIKSSEPYQRTALGVISTSPGFVTNATAPDADDSTQRPLALSGRVPVKVTNENGSVRPGDYLTSSSTPGHAMKATKAGVVIGRAMDSFDGETGKVLMFIDNSYYNPYDAQNIQGGDGVFTGLVVSGQIKTTELVVEGNSTFMGNITVNGHVVSGGGVPQTELGVALGGPDSSEAQLSLEGNDTSGELTITTGPDGQTYLTGELLNLRFHKPFTKVPRIMLSASNEHAVRAEVFVTSRTERGFVLRTLEPLAPNTTYSFTYWVVE